MTVLLIFLFILGILSLVWLSTLHFFTPNSGQLAIQKHFETYVGVIGDVPKIEIPKKRLDTITQKAVKKIIVDDKVSTWKFFIYPNGIETFEYRYKKFRTLEEIRNTGGAVVWQPSIEKDKDGKPVKKENGPETIGLGEWKEPKKASLFVREREDIIIKIRSKDGINAVVKGYIKFLVWDMMAAASATYQFKYDPEKNIIDQFQDWAKEKDYFKDINGVSFEKIDNADDFFKKLNRDIYVTGVIVEDVELTEFLIEPDSKDVAEAQELKIKNEFLRQAEEQEKQRKILEGEGNRLRQEQENIAQEDLQKKLAGVDVDKDRKLKENEVMQFKKEQEIKLKNNKVLIDKLSEYKGVEDVTETKKAEHLGKVTGTVILHEKGSGSGSNLDDKLLEAEVIGNSLTSKK